MWPPFSFLFSPRVAWWWSSTPLSLPSLPPTSGLQRRGQGWGRERWGCPLLLPSLISMQRLPPSLKCPLPTPPLSTLHTRGSPSLSPPPFLPPRSLMAKERYNNTLEALWTRCSGRRGGMCVEAGHGQLDTFSSNPFVLAYRKASTLDWILVSRRRL